MCRLLKTSFWKEKGRAIFTDCGIEMRRQISALAEGSASGRLRKLSQAQPFTKQN